jgi:hypothetical protein
VLSEELAAESRSKAGNLVGSSVHGRVNQIVVFNDKSYFRVTVTLHFEIS